MKRALAAVGLGATIAWLALPGSPALACTCDVTPLPSQMAAADAVFRGEVLSLTPAGAELRAEMRVLRIYKGDPNPVVDVHAASSPDVCGLQFAREGEYVVFARSASGGYTTSLCAGTTDDTTLLERSGYSGREAVTTLLADARPIRGDAAARTTPIAGAAVALAGVVAAHAVRARARTARERARRARARAYTRT